MLHLSETKEILKIEQKAFVLLLIKRRAFSGTPGIVICLKMRNLVKGEDLQLLSKALMYRGQMDV